ncbi:energy transducer TonB [uncultured Ramlibacter sp.]|uniref:energy transducer TonB family protein n=1 Tax=uncultured Ramlibacter sp. TaxID=260755 RepID=UPI002611448E|nr:energy transducer TonB [uncultured Ramlibacter sp.]
MTRPLLAAVLVLALLGLAPLARAEAGWPEKIVTIEDLVPLTRMQFRVVRNRREAEKGLVGPAVLRAHLDAQGLVRRVVLVQSCGSPAFDKSAMDAMLAMRFEPKLVEGQPSEVTLVVPLHFPVAKAQAAP